MPGARPPRSFRALLGDRAATFAVMTALSAPFALALAAFAIDEGSIYTERREAQAMVDLAAITAASNIDDYEAAVTTTLGDNGMPGVIVRHEGESVHPLAGQTVVTVTPGRYSALASVEAGQRFKAGKTPTNAIHVTLHKVGMRFFASSLLPPTVIGTQATASLSPQAMFSVGSRLASLNGGILNAVLNKLLGANVSLSVMDYNALLAADIDVLSFMDALAVKLHVTGPTYADVLASRATVGQIATAMADVPGLDNTARLSLLALASSATNSLQIPLSHLVDLGPVGNLALGQRPQGLSVGANAMSVLSAAAALANGTNQVQVNLGATIPGLVSATLDIAIGEPQQFSPWLAIGEKGAVVRTAQTRIKLTASVGLGNSSLGGGIKLLSVRLPVHVEVASAEAKLTDITCPSGRPDSLDVAIAARPGVAALHIGESNAAGFADFSKPLSFTPADIASVSIKLLLININLLTVSGQSSVAITNMNPVTLHFDSADVAAKKVKTVATHDLTQSLTTSLVANLSLSVNALGLGLDVSGLLGTLRPAIQTLLGGVTAPVDDLLYNVLAVLGVHVGEADVRVHGATCSRAVLVQ